MLNVAFSELKMKKGKVVLTNRGSINIIKVGLHIKYLFFIAFTISAFASPPNFGKYDGTAVILDLNTSKKETFNQKRADERLSPCSTFKILNSSVS